MNAYIPIPYQVYYVIIPTISLIGNGSVVYVTIRSRTLRSACNIFIALISFGDAVHMFAHFAMIVLYYKFLYTSDVMRENAEIFLEGSIQDVAVPEIPLSLWATYLSFVDCDNCFSTSPRSLPEAFVARQNGTKRSPNHLIRQDVCVRWQLLPIFGMSFSLVLLFNVAVDRLLSLHRVYHGISNVYKSLYVGIQVFIATALSTFVVVVVYASSRRDRVINAAFVLAVKKMFKMLQRNTRLSLAHLSSEKYQNFEQLKCREVACIMTAVMHGPLKGFFINGVAVFMALILACYVLFLIRIKKVEIRDKNLRSVYRSLILISVTLVFGWFATAAIVNVLSLLNVDISEINRQLLVGIFINLSMMSNFFIYYVMSQQYRDSFDHYLPSSMLRNVFRLEKPTCTIPLATITKKIIGRNVV